MRIKKQKILLAEGNANLSSLLQEYLETKGFLVEKTKTIKEGYDLFCQQEYDLCLLDSMMPRMDGRTLAQKIRIANSNTPIIFFIEELAEKNPIEGFNRDTDDYITKPLQIKDLFTRIQTILRGHRKMEVDENDKAEFTIGRYVFNSDNYTLISNQETIRLIKKENKLMRLFALNKNELLERSFMLQIIWQEDNYFNGRSMDVYITKLRKYLKHDQRIEIKNIHGKGFKLLIKS